MPNALRASRFSPVVLALLLLPTSAVAQEWGQPWADPMDRPPRVDISASAGFVAPTDWSDLVVLGSLSSATGALEQVLVRDVRVEPGRSFSASATYWRSRYGFRVQGSYSDSSLEFGSPLGDNDLLGSVDVDTWMYDARLAVGLIEYAPQRIVWPYVFLGAGGISYDLSRTVTPPLLTFIERAPPESAGRSTVIVEENGRQFLVAVDELGLETVLAFNVGIGADFRLPLGGGGLGVRFEVSDHFAKSPLGLRVQELGLGSAADAIRFGLVHHLRASAGVVVQIGK
jgi:hypothetical protein